jgi:hypothetical protein
VGELGQAEIENLHASVARNKNILRLQIAMNDPLLVRGRQTTRNLFTVLGGFAHRQGAGTHPLAQGLTLQKLGHEVRRAFMLAEVVNGEDVGMIQRCNRLRLLLKTPQLLGIAGESPRQDLDRDLAVEPRIPRPIHLAHAASAQRTNNFIWTEFGTRDKGHPRSPL